MARQPILPSNTKDPTGQAGREARAEKDWNRRLRAIEKLYRELLDSLPTRTVTTNATMYETTPEILALSLADVGDQVDRLLLQGGTQDLWFTEAYVEPAYVQGTAQQLSNLSVQSAAYAATRPNLTALLMSQPYQTRLGFLRVRQYDNMVGLSADIKRSMSLVLQDGLAAGLNTRTIAANLTAQTGIEQRRASLIAQTEIPGALRQARMAEADQARVELGLLSREMHMSALLPTTRATHRARHGTLHTTEEQRIWWSQDGNRYRCHCSTVTVLVDAEGKPLTPGVVDRARAMLEKNPAPA